MFLHVTDARYLDGYRLRLAFNDGNQGAIDLRDELYGELFEPLKDMERFRCFRLEGHTLTWDNGADFAPEFLQEQLAMQARAV